MLTNDTNISADIIFSNIYDDSYFFNQNMYNAYYSAVRLLHLGSEAEILSGELLKWELDSEYWHNDEVVYSYQLMDLRWNSAYAWIDGENDTPEKRAELEQEAIRQQLREFRSVMDVLTKTKGLLYIIKDASGNKLYGNTDMPSSSFKLMPVYYLCESDGAYEFSHDAYFGLYDSYNGGSSVFIAFTDEIVSEMNAWYFSVKDMYVLDISVAAASAVLVLALLIILLTGAGRRAGYDETVRFLLIDKPFLDVSLAIVFCWSVIGCWGAAEFSWTIWRYKNVTAMNLLFAAASFVIVSPVLLWLMSLAKRIKTGRFWRHTLLWFIPSRLMRFIKSLWSGFRLTAKVGIIAAASFFSLILMGFIGDLSHNSFFPVLLSALFITAVTVFLLLRYARRIRSLEQGAKAASLGSYASEINAGGGELGHIADSINNISAGINSAVGERMKSERLKTELITNVSHDIRTPLTSIITYTDLLKNEGLGCEKAPEYLDVLIQKSQRLKTLTDELFEAAKAASGNIDVDITELDLVSLINQVLGELDSTIKASGLELRVKLPEKLIVMADGKLMWRVFENLLSNVFKYSLKNSRVYLEAGRESLSIRVDLKNISAMELNMDPSELTDRFKRGDEARADGGSGLGLSIVQSFMAAQGGRLALSIDGDLFKASIYLPAK